MDDIEKTAPTVARRRRQPGVQPRGRRPRHAELNGHAEPPAHHDPDASTETRSRGLAAQALMPLSAVRGKLAAVESYAGTATFEIQVPAESGLDESDPAFRWTKLAGPVRFVVVEHARHDGTQSE
jgi:hypothetical protein